MEGPPKQGDEEEEHNFHSNPRLLSISEDNGSNCLFKQVQWSPDGTSILASKEDNILATYILPADVLETPADTHRTLLPHTQVHECAPSKSCIWYPAMNLQSPETCCFVNATIDQPVHLWDALTAKVRASYPLIDHRERYISPYCMTFSRDAEDIIFGANSMISISSISYPGPPYTSIATTKLLPRTKGIISALSVSQDGLLAAATFNNIVSFFSPTYQHISTFQTSNGSGITEVKWSPDSRYLYIIPRQSEDIEVWDVRSTGEVVGLLSGRRANTNQRIWTDLSGDGKWLVSGGTDGRVQGWKTSTVSGTVQSEIEFVAHEDCVSSAVLNPAWPMLATCSGSHHFDIEEDKGHDKAEYKMKVWLFD